jgi:hypothetical protein
MLADGGYDPAWRSLAWAAFAVAMITDIFDGHLARTYNLVTDFGKIADPIADKAIIDLLMDEAILPRAGARIDKLARLMVATSASQWRLRHCDAR